MKKLSFMPEIFIWLTFFVVAGFGYTFSFLGYMDSKANMSASNIIIPILVWILLASICTFLLKSARSTKCFIQFSGTERLILECSILVLLLIGGWVFRFVDCFHGVWPTELDNTFFQYAQVSQNAEAYLNPHVASRIYVAFLHIICLFLGNVYEVGAFVQFLLLIAAVIVWYATIRKAFGVVAALFFAGGAMLLPNSIQTSMQCNPTMLLLVIYGCIAFLIVRYAYSEISGAWATICEFFLAIFLVAAIFLDISGVLLIPAYWIALKLHINRTKGNVALSVLITSIGIWVFFQSYSELVWELPHYNGVREFVFSLGKHLVLFLRHDFAIYMGMSILLGVSIQQYWGLSVETAEEKQEPIVTVVKFEEEPAVTIPERPQIFIPKSMEIPKRVSKPKVDFTVEVEQEKMHYDYPVKDTDDFDI